ncbi:hypothetical protein SAMN06264365_1211 [Actinoplanes regularis]|uniref:Uncharacterized protein n=1 Tax=Actinoplanes regularis TaxID=52697 RepID=A0A239GIA7_9ACTN|nr:hypothetical protein SAMN06264365_1211 [Actinoplanes regularis]
MPPRRPARRRLTSDLAGPSAWISRLDTRLVSRQAGSAGHHARITSPWTLAGLVQLGPRLYHQPPDGHGPQLSRFSWLSCLYCQHLDSHGVQPSGSGWLPWWYRRRLMPPPWPGERLAWAVARWTRKPAHAPRRRMPPEARSTSVPGPSPGLYVHLPGPPFRRKPTSRPGWPWRSCQQSRYERGVQPGGLGRIGLGWVGLWCWWTGWGWASSWVGWGWASSWGVGWGWASSWVGWGWASSRVG